MKKLLSVYSYIYIVTVTLSMAPGPPRRAGTGCLKARVSLVATQLIVARFGLFIC